MIAIKGMEMPSCCDECCMQIDGLSAGYYCAITNDEMCGFEPWKHRHPNCPLVEIITCKDCKHWVKDLTSRVPDDKEYHFCPMIDFNTSEDYYCADAERRE